MRYITGVVAKSRLRSESAVVFIRNTIAGGRTDLIEPADFREEDRLCEKTCLDLRRDPAAGRLARSALEMVGWQARCRRRLWKPLDERRREDGKDLQQT